MTRIPILIVGDGPRLHSGLARIARDLTARLLVAQDELGIRVAQVGIDPPIGWHWTAWDFYGFQEGQHSYGREELTEALQTIGAEGHGRPIVWLITDPSRCYDFLRRPLPGTTEVELSDLADFWGYFPIDSHNPHGAIGGPALQAAQACQRVIAYGAYGAKVLHASLKRGIPALPHGLEPGVWVPTPPERTDDGFAAWTAAVPENAIRIGAVATNQPRKDLGLYFAALAYLEQIQSRPVYAWLHTDLLTRAWDIGQLAHDFGMTREQVFVSTQEITDVQLAARYSWSHVTFAPGLGEGFGYPIVESLGCGTPVVHGDFAGGAALIPNRDWLIRPVAYRYESCYVLTRPVYRPEHAAETLYKTYRQVIDVPSTRAYCAGSVRHLWWDQLWPRWEAWVRQGLTEQRQALEAAHA